MLHSIEPQYRIDRPTLQDIVYAPATGRISWPAAVEQCKRRNMLPASAGQVWAFRLEADGTDHANEYFACSTAAIYFFADGKPAVAFYDTQRPDGSDNLLITNAQEGYNTHREHRKWLIPLQEKTLTAMLKTAEQQDRIITPGHRELSLDGAYATDASTTAILGDRLLAGNVQTWLRAKGYATGYHWLLNANDMSTLGVNHEYAELRRVGVGGVSDFVNVNNLYAYDRCNYTGRARGVRKLFTGN
jgi:hypothetical protein